MKTWRVFKEGKPNLNCVLNGHKLCKSECLTVCKGSQQMGHCKCGLRLVWTDDEKLLDLGDYYATAEAKLNGRAIEDD